MHACQSFTVFSLKSESVRVNSSSNHQIRVLYFSEIFNEVSTSNNITIYENIIHLPIIMLELVLRIYKNETGVDENSKYNFL